MDWDANIGLRGTSFPALDIDCHDEAITRTVRRIAFNELGPAPARVGKSPKELLVYRTCEPFSRVAVRILTGKDEHLD